MVLDDSAIDLPATRPSAARILLSLASVAVVPTLCSSAIRCSAARRQLTVPDLRWCVPGRVLTDECVSLVWARLRRVDSAIATCSARSRSLNSYLTPSPGMDQRHHCSSRQTRTGTPRLSETTLLPRLTPRCHRDLRQRPTPTMTQHRSEPRYVLRRRGAAARTGCPAGATAGPRARAGGPRGELAWLGSAGCDDRSE